MKLWIIDGQEFDTYEDAAQEILDNMDESTYDNMLDECYEAVRIGKIEFSPSQVLEKCDPIAYRCGFSDWQDSEMSYIVEELQDMEDGDETTVYGFSVEVKEAEDEE